MVPWLILMAFQAFQHGYKQNKMPEPFYFFGGSAAMALAGLVAMANNNAGTALAWGLLIAAFVGGQMNPVDKNTEKLGQTKLVWGVNTGAVETGVPAHARTRGPE